MTSPHSARRLSGDATESTALIKALVAVRKARRLTQEAVAQRIHTGQSNVSDFERQRTASSLQMLHRYARAVGARILYTVEIEEITNEED